jgi:site-specific DNA recombinase
MQMQKSQPNALDCADQYATGKYSLNDLANIAKSECLFAERAADRIVATVYSNLTNPFYYGEFRFKKKLYKGTYEPLITKELWDRVQETLRQRGTRKPRKVKHDFAFKNLIQCGHCGCSLIGEVKKKKYTYYHCTFYKGKCPEPYVREEVLEEKFTDVLRSLRFDEEILDFVRQALRESHEDERRGHQEALTRLQTQYNRLQRWIDTAYEDRLDGRITAEEYDRKVVDWRSNQEDVCRSIDAHRNADQAYLDAGIGLLELADRAADLFAKQPPREKRRLLDFVLSNSTWANGELTPEFRQPFDMIAVEATKCAREKAAGVSSDDLHQNRLPDEDSNLGQSG